MESLAVTDLSDLKMFQCPEEWFRDYGLYIVLAKRGVMDTCLVYDEETGHVVGFGGLHHAEWGLEGVWIPGTNMTNPLGFYRMMMDEILHITEELGYDLYCHNTPGSTSAKLMPRMGFENIAVLQGDGGTVLRWRRKGC